MLAKFCDAVEYAEVLHNNKARYTNDIELIKFLRIDGDINKKSFFTISSIKHRNMFCLITWVFTGKENTLKEVKIFSSPESCNLHFLLLKKRLEMTVHNV